MYIARVRLSRFRGFEDSEILLGENVVVVGEPRAGRTDLVLALRRVLDPRSTSARPQPLDVHRPPPGAHASDETNGPEPLTEVHVTLLGLGDDLEQALDERLELIDPNTGLPTSAAAANEAEMGIRLRYCLRYDLSSDQAEHWVDYPATGLRAPRVEREALRAVFLDRNAPLQLRAEGAFRALMAGRDEPALQTALTDLASDVASATDRLASSAPVREAVRQLVAHGAEQLLEVPGPTPEEAVGFAAEDGSLAALLRAVQPTLTLDAAGPLPLASHGSTTAGILTAAEAALAAQPPDAVVIADDFGDDLDAAAAEYLAALLRRRVGQVWLSTRRPEVVRAFRPEELLRLTRSHGQRRQHQLDATVDRKERVARRQLHLHLIPAMTAREVALLEGPHDLEGYTAVADRRLRASGTAPPAAHGIRLVASSGAEGGKEQLPRLARLAGQLGFHVRVVLDHDKPGTDAALIAELATSTDQVIRLPERTAIERALVRGVPNGSLRAALRRIDEQFDLRIDESTVADDDLEDKIVWALKQKGGLHKPFVDSLVRRRGAPPLAVAVLDLLSAPPGSQVVVELANP